MVEQGAESEGPEDRGGGGRLRRRRRANSRADARSVEQKVRLTPAELELLRGRAAAAGVTVPRLMVESAFAEGSQTASDYRRIGMDLLSAQTTLGRAADNMNQVARKANTIHEVPSSFCLAIAEMRACVDTMSGAITVLVRAVEGVDPQPGAGSDPGGETQAEEAGQEGRGELEEDWAHEPDDSSEGASGGRSEVTGG